MNLIDFHSLTMRSTKVVFSFKASQNHPLKKSDTRPFPLLGAESGTETTPTCDPLLILSAIAVCSFHANSAWAK